MDFQGKKYGHVLDEIQAYTCSVLSKNCRYGPLFSDNHKINSSPGHLERRNNSTEIVMKKEKRLTCLI